MPKITFMGAGSTVFAKNVLGDSMVTPALEESTIALYDIDAKRLEESYLMLTAINNNYGNKARIEKYCGVENRKAALRGANYVVNAIQVGGYEPCTVTDFEIPKKYGLRQTIADTLGIGGIFRALRTIPVMMDFARDMEEVCPDAWLLNYTNPMAMLTGAMQRFTGVKTVGLCHSVQYCVPWLLKPIGMEPDARNHCRSSRPSRTCGTQAVRLQHLYIPHRIPLDCSGTLRCQTHPAFWAEYRSRILHRTDHR